MTAPASSRQARTGLLLILGAITLAVAADYRSSLAHGPGPVHALRTMEPVSQPADETAGSVAPFCGFAPCGMPLECAP